MGSESEVRLGSGFELTGDKGAVLGSLSYDFQEEDEEMSDRHNDAKAAAAWTYAKESGRRPITPIIKHH